MATVNGVNYAKVIDPSGSNIVGPGIWGGRVRVQRDEYTLVSVASGTVIRMAKLPAGARVLDVKIQHETGAASFTLAVGNAGSGQGAIFAAAIASVTATIAPRSSMLTAASGYTVGTLSGDDVVTVTTGGATSAASQKVVCETYYVID
jgi:hypothetical protein